METLIIMHIIIIIWIHDQESVTYILYGVTTKDVYLLLTVSGLNLVSAWRTSSVYSPADPVSFETVGANIGNMWNTSKHKFTMKAMQGVFYVAMDAGPISGRSLNFVLRRSNQHVASCSHTFVNSWNADSVGRDVILKVNLSDSLHFSSSTGLYSDSAVYNNMAIFNIGELMTTDKDPVIFSVALMDSLLPVLSVLRRHEQALMSLVAPSWLL